RVGHFLDLINCVRYMPGTVIAAQLVVDALLQRVSQGGARVEFDEQWHEELFMRQVEIDDDRILHFLDAADAAIYFCSADTDAVAVECCIGATKHKAAIVIVDPEVV